MVIGHQQGRDTKENLKRNFGMPHPEGYRKALRLMKLADKFERPVITFIDTPGAYPGLGAEERGQSEAMARNLLEMVSLPTPIVAMVIGEGGSGGALALGVADRVLMLENSVYSVISVEGCAAILWKDASQRERAAEALKLTPADLLRLKVIDEIVKEPVGGAARGPGRHRRSPAGSADPPCHRAPEDPAGEARPSPGRQVWRHGCLHRGLMPQTVEVRFKGTRKAYFLWADEADPIRLKEPVIVEVERGRDLGRVTAVGETAAQKCGGCTSCAVGEVAQEPAALKPVLRRATAEDLKVHRDIRLSEEDVRQKVIERVRAHELLMKVSDTEWQWDRSKLTIYFTADKRVDFRALVRDLASLFRTRIELRQIGVRDEAARLSGVGRCGREYCCSTWLKELSPVNLGLAKDQHLSLNPSQISGGCGRLLCCLKYEHEFYVTARKRFPKEGKTIRTSVGAERVIAVDIFRERVFLRNEEQGSRIIPLAQLRLEVEQLGDVLPSAEERSRHPVRTAEQGRRQRRGDGPESKA